MLAQGLNCSGTMMVVYILFMEFFAPENKGIVSSIEGMIECLILTFHVIMVRYVTTNTQVLLAFSFSAAALSFVGLMWIDESPIWLIKTGNLK